MYSVLNKLSEYIYFTYQKTLIHRLFCLFLKLLKAFSVSLIQVKLNRSSHQRCSVKKLFLKNRNIFRKTPVLEHLSNKVRRSGLQHYQKEIPTQEFFCEYCEIFSNTYFQHLRTAAYFFLQFTRIHTSPLIKTEKILNRPITELYSDNDVNVIAAELRLAKRGQLLFIRKIIVYKKQCQQM